MLHEPAVPERARRLVGSIQLCCMPRHGSWVNIAERELSCMAWQCLCQRHIGDLETLQTAIEARSSSLNRRQRDIAWRLKIGVARRKPKSVYPKTVL